MALRVIRTCASDLANTPEGNTGRQPASNRIPQLLRKRGNDTVEGPSAAIGLAPATIRGHLDILQEGRKKTGRPEYSFFLTEQGHDSLPKSYGLLLGLLAGKLAELTVADTRGRDGRKSLELLFQRLSDDVWNQHRGQVAGRDSGHRLGALVTVLKEADFSPEAEVATKRLGTKRPNCRFRSVAVRNKSVCSFDAHLISSMLRVEFT